MTTPTLVADRYRLDRRLGAGGMSTVFLALDSVLERQVAVKLLAEHLADDEAFVARFRREALAAARLQHPNIVQVFDSGEDEGSGRHYIVMEFVEGPSGSDLIRDHGALDLDLAVTLLRDACHGLDYAHRGGIVHRDVKPGNLLLVEHTGAAKLADFGIAKAAEQDRITQIGAVLGTAAYLSPEQALGEESRPASDIYSLGVCAYQFLAGRLPHQYSSLTDLARQQQEGAIEPITSHRPEVPSELDRAVRRCLERDPADRWPSALDLADALEAGFRAEGTAATMPFDDDYSTQALPGTGSLEDETGPTRLLPRRPGAPVAPPARRLEPAVPRDAEVRERERPRRSPAQVVVLLLVILLVGVAVALIATSGGGGDSLRAPNEESVPDQIQGLRDLIRENTE